jgi:hypothetical protein
MYMKRLACLFLLLPGAWLWCQTQEYGIDYSEEYLLGANLNSNAGLIGGGFFRYSKQISSKRLHGFSLEIVNVKHPKEVRQSNQVSGNLYILGKRNYLFSIRPSYCQEFLFFSKAKEDGIQIDGIIGLGPSIGIVKPYYIEYDYITSTRVEAYDPAIHKDNFRILGSGGMFTGFGNSTLAGGLHFKAGVSFEYGSFSNGVTGVEAGWMLEAYNRKIPILDIFDGLETFNRRVFSSVYLNIYFGAR